MFLRSVTSLASVTIALSACGSKRLDSSTSLSASRQSTEIKSLCQDVDQQFIVKFPKVSARATHFQLQASDMGEDSLRTLNCSVRTDAISKFTIFRCRDHGPLLDLYTTPERNLMTANHVVFYPTNKTTRVLCQQL